MKTWTAQVIETRTVGCSYLIEAESQEEANRLAGCVLRDPVDVSVADLARLQIHVGLEPLRNRHHHLVQRRLLAEDYELVGPQATASNQRL